MFEAKQLRGAPSSSSSCAFSFVLYSPGLLPWHTNYIFHAQLSVFCLKYLSLSAGLIFIKKKHFQRNPLESFFVCNPPGWEEYRKTIHRFFNVLTLSRCPDHKQSIFVLVWYICGFPVCIYEGVSACLSQLTEKKRFPVWSLTETDAEIKRR